VVKKSLKSLLYSNSLSPNLIILRPAFNVKFLSRIGSSVGSSDSSTDSNKTTLPNLIAFSSGFKKTPAPSLILRALRSFSSFFLIQARAYN